MAKRERPRSVKDIIQRGMKDYSTAVEVLQLIGDDPTREGLKETPDRWIKALQFWFSGYKCDPKSLLKVFKDGSEDYDQMVFQSNIPVWSHCEHHIAPFFGVAHIAYIPDGKIVGLSKLSRLTDVLSRRLQVQERLTSQIASHLQEALNPKGVAVCVQCRHTCMESRGVCKAGTETTTQKFFGAFLDEPETRAEFMALVSSAKK